MEGWTHRWTQADGWTNARTHTHTREREREREREPERREKWADRD